MLKGGAMTIEYKLIQNLIEELDRIHQKHIDSFDRELLPDLEQHCKERNEAIERLVTEMNRFVHAIGSLPDAETSDEGVISLMKGISTLLEQNRVLAEKVKSHKDDIERSMKRISSEKKVLHAYGSPSYLSNRPRVISYTQ